MASITSAGIGSGLDVASLVQQLVASERAPADQRLSRIESAAKLQISALGAYRSAMATLQSAVKALKADASVNKLVATSSDSKIFTASTATGATAGSYDVEVVALARASKLVSGAYADSAASVGAGTVTIGVGTQSFQVTLDPGADSLASLRDAINGAADNAGVIATIVTESGGAHLLLTAKDTGTSHALAVTGGPAMTEQQPAADAHVKIEGFDYYSASNIVGGAIDGVTLTLGAAAPGTALTLNVALDAAASTAAISNFVGAYNKAVLLVAQTSRFDAATRTGGPLMGDAAVRGMTQQLRNLVGGSFSGAGAYALLSSIGISAATDGTLTVDAGKLSAALTADRASVQKLFSGSSGLATQMGAVLDSFLAETGQVRAETDGLQARLDDVARRKTALDRHMTAVEARYRAQFTALDSLIGQLRSTGDFLSRQLASLGNS